MSATSTPDDDRAAGPIAPGRGGGRSGGGASGVQSGAGRVGSPTDVRCVRVRGGDHGVWRVIATYHRQPCRFVQLSSISAA